MKITALNSLRFLVSLLFAMNSSALFAQVKVFDAEISSQWDENLNWDPNGIPMPTDTAIISNGLTATITGVQVPDVVRLEIGMGALAGTLSIDGAGGMARLTVLEEVDIGPRGELEVGFSSAQLVVVGPELRSQGDVTVSTGGLITASQQYTQNNGSTVLVHGGGPSPPTIDTTTMRINAGELRGDGQINGNVIVGRPLSLQTATISPGAGIGDLAINGDLELTSRAEFVVDIDASGPTVLADELSVTGTVTLGGTLDLSSLVGTLPVGQKFTFLVANDVAPDTFFDEILGTETEDGGLYVGYELTTGGDYTFNVYLQNKFGDMNGDGSVTELDAPLFAWAVFDRGIYVQKYLKSGGHVPGVCDGGACYAGPPSRANMDDIQSLNFLDLPLFLEAVENDGGSPVMALSEVLKVLNGPAIPEPSTMGLAFAAMAMFTFSRNGVGNASGRTGHFGGQFNR